MPLPVLHVSTLELGFHAALCSRSPPGLRHWADAVPLQPVVHLRLRVGLLTSRRSVASNKAEVHLRESTQRIHIKDKWMLLVINECSQISTTGCWNLICSLFLAWPMARKAHLDAVLRPRIKRTAVRHAMMTYHGVSNSKWYESRSWE